MERNPHRHGEHLKEMTDADIAALEVEPMQVVGGKGVVQSKIESTRKPDIAGMQNRIRTEQESLNVLQEKLARETISGKMAQARATEAQIDQKKRAIEKIKNELMHTGEAGNA